MANASSAKKSETFTVFLLLFKVDAFLFCRFLHRPCGCSSSHIVLASKQFLICYDDFVENRRYDGKVATKTVSTGIHGENIMNTSKPSDTKFRDPFR